MACYQEFLHHLSLRQDPGTEVRVFHQRLVYPLPALGSHLRLYSNPWYLGNLGQIMNRHSWATVDELGSNYHGVVKIAGHFGVSGFTQNNLFSN